MEPVKYTKKLAAHRETGAALLAEKDRTIAKLEEIRRHPVGLMERSEDDGGAFLERGRLMPGGIPGS